MTQANDRTRILGVIDTLGQADWTDIRKHLPDRNWRAVATAITGLVEDGEIGCCLGLYARPSGTDDERGKR